MWWKGGLEITGRMQNFRVQTSGGGTVSSDDQVPAVSSGRRGVKVKALRDQGWRLISMDAEITKHDQSMEEQRPKPARLVRKHPGGHPVPPPPSRSMRLGGRFHKWGVPPFKEEEPCMERQWKDNQMARRETPGGSHVPGVRGMCRLTCSLTSSQRRGLLMLAALSTPKRLMEMGRRESHPYPGVGEWVAEPPRTPGAWMNQLCILQFPGQKDEWPRSSEHPATCESN